MSCIHGAGRGCRHMEIQADPMPKLRHYVSASDNRPIALTSAATPTAQQMAGVKPGSSDPSVKTRWKQHERTTIVVNLVRYNFGAMSQPSRCSSSIAVTEAAWHPLAQRAFPNSNTAHVHFFILFPGNTMNNPVTSWARNMLSMGIRVHRLLDDVPCARQVKR